MKEEMLHRILIILHVIETSGAVVISITNNTVPIRGNDIQLQCLVSHYPYGARWLISRYSEPLTMCFPDVDSTSFCLTTRIGRYRFSADSAGIYVNISSLNRTEDAIQWQCLVPTGGSGYDEDTFDLQVYTSPGTAQLISPSTSAVDLAQQSVTLQCSSSQCGYTSPAPTFLWLYRDGNSDVEYTLDTANVGTRSSLCDQAEKYYTSTLTIPQYRTFSDNSSHIHRFTCQMKQSLLSIDTTSSLTSNIIFVVRVTSATLKDSGKTLTEGTLTVIDGEQKTLTCDTIPSNAHPAITVTWYIGTQIRDTDISYTFIPTKVDNGKQIFCKANNANYVEESGKLTLSVNDPTTPERPKHLSAVTTESLVVLQWTSPFNGGAVQTFMVQYKHPTAENWTEHNEVIPDPGQNATVYYVLDGNDLSHGYSIRVFSHNVAGRSEWTEEIIAKENTQNASSGCMIQPKETDNNTTIIALAVICAMLATMCVVFIVLFFLQRRRVIVKETGRQGGKETEVAADYLSPTYDEVENTNDGNVTETKNNTDIISKEMTYETQFVPETKNQYDQLQSGILSSEKSGVYQNTSI